VRLLERSVSVDHSTIQRWVERYAGELESVFRKRHKRYGPYISWRMNETYVKLYSATVSQDSNFELYLPKISVVKPPCPAVLKSLADTPAWVFGSLKLDGIFCGYKTQHIHVRLALTRQWFCVLVRAASKSVII
jgi:hypothetical protein